MMNLTFWWCQMAHQRTIQPNQPPAVLDEKPEDQQSQRDSSSGRHDFLHQISLPPTQSLRWFNPDSQWWTKWLEDQPTLTPLVSSLTKNHVVKIRKTWWSWQEPALTVCRRQDANICLYFSEKTIIVCMITRAHVSGTLVILCTCSIKRPSLSFFCETVSLILYQMLRKHKSPNHLKENILRGGNSCLLFVFWWCNCTWKYLLLIAHICFTNHSFTNNYKALSWHLLHKKAP